ncbi:MAG TPA: choice-of-anchor Q domain-containing protein [Candidatus Binataceae bacterium]|nr:choice-of-anchor Q domain-containing protein [Candidatus Binataceae bacterium]
MTCSRILAMSALVAAFAIAGIKPGAAKTPPPPICVNVGGTSGCFSSIQAAVNAAPTETTINVSPGTYFENVTIGGGEVAILNSTISGNVAEAGSASGSAGGGIENNGGKVTLNNVTIADNTAGTGGGVDTSAGRNFKISNSIISNDTGTELDNDCAGKIDSRGFNLILDTTGCTFIGKTSTDITGMDPLLQALALNLPGTTETQALTAGSPALTKGNPATPNGKGIRCFATGQNGLVRPKGECDIGAFQLSGVI